MFGKNNPASVFCSPFSPSAPPDCFGCEWGRKKSTKGGGGDVNATRLAWPVSKQAELGRNSGKMSGLFSGQVRRLTGRTAGIKSCALKYLVGLTTVSWSPRTSSPHQTRSRMAAVSSAHSRFHNSRVKSGKYDMEHPESAFKLKTHNNKRLERCDFFFFFLHNMLCVLLFSIHNSNSGNYRGIDCTKKRRKNEQISKD